MGNRLFVAVLLEKKNHRIGYQYIGPFDSDAACQDWCDKQNAKSDLESGFHFVSQMVSEVF